MKKKNNKDQASTLVEELVKKTPVLTKEEMDNFCTFEEIIANAKKMFDDKVKNIIAQYDKYKNR